MRFSAMGDVAMTVPVLLALQRDYPDVEVVMLSRKRFEPLFNQLKNVNFVEARLSDRHKGIVGLYRLAKQLKTMDIDAVVDLHNVLRTKVLRNFMSKIPSSKLDKGRADKKKLVSDPAFFEPLKHTTQRYADAFTDLGFSIKLEHNEFLSTLTLPDEVNSSVNTDGYVLIGFSPFAAHKTKALTVNKAKRITQQLARIPNAQVVLIGGGEKEARKLQLVAATTPHVINLAGTTSFENELAIISNLDVMIAMDSGNGHLAAIYGVPTITLWGNTHPYAGFAPYAQPRDNQLTANRKKYPLLPTSIFGDKKVEGYRKVTNSIKTKRLIQRLEEVLNLPLSSKTDYN